MARHFDDFEDDREFRTRRDRLERERPWNYGHPYSGGRLESDYGQRDFGQGRFGERAGYQNDEPRYNEYVDRSARDDYRRPTYEGRDRSWRPHSEDMGYQPRARYDESVSRSRLRVRDIMTRELAVATRDTSLHDVAVMMKEEDTGVIPVVEFRPVMSTDVHVARPHERVVDVIRKMGDKQVRRIPVANENGNLLGIVSMADIALETEADRELADSLEDISRESSFWHKLFG